MATNTAAQTTVASCGSGLLVKVSENIENRTAKIKEIMKIEEDVINEVKRKQKL